MPATATTAVGTVAMRRELAAARVLAGSLAPPSRLWVLLLDDLQGEVDGAAEPFELLRPEDAGLERGRFEQLAALLAPPALRAVARAWLIRKLWQETGGPLLYMEPSCRVYGPLDDAGRLLQSHDLLLTPSLGAPIPDDGRQPGHLEAATWGAYDAGFMGVGPSPELARILDWWAEESAAEGFRREEPGSRPQMSWWIDEEARPPAADVVPRVEPRPASFLDLAAGMAPRPYLLTDPGYNAGYWNLYGRGVERREGTYEIGGRPLRVFNFRGFDPRRPSMLSRQQDRISLAENPGLARLCETYAAELEEQGAMEQATLPSSFDVLADGTPFTVRLRRLYRQWMESGALIASPFDEAGRRAFVHWLREPAEVGDSIAPNRYLLAIYMERLDLQRALPAGHPEFRERLAEWARTAGREETDIPDELLPGEAAPKPGPMPAGRPSRGPSVRSAAAIPAEGWGVNVIGFHRLDFGIAEAGRLAIEALDARSVPLLPIHDFSLARYKAAGPPFATLGLEAARFPINLLCMNGDHILDLVQRKGTAFLDDRYTIGLWFWEADRLPDSWLGAFDLLDEVWAPSAYVREAVAPLSPVPVTQVRLPLRAEPPPSLDRAAYGIDEDAYLFLFVFDFDSVGMRKNPLGAVEAFRRAFEPGSGAALLLKSSFSGNAVGDYEALRQAAAGHPDIHLVDRRVPGRERDALIGGCDCYLSLHRSEGFGLTPAEAMLYGKPVIATGHGGNTDFMTAENSYLVDFEPAPVGEGREPYPAEAHWAEPDLGQAAELMRMVFENREEARRRGMRAAEELGRSHSPDAAGRIMEDRLAQIRQSLQRELEPQPASGIRARFGRLLSRRSEPAPAQQADAELPALSAAMLATLRAQERRVRELERARSRQGTRQPMRDLSEP